MAKAEKIPVAPTPPPSYRLELSESEAQLVKALVGRVVGGQHGSSSIYHALHYVGIAGGFDIEGSQNIRVVTK